MEEATTIPSGVQRQDDMFLPRRWSMIREVIKREVAVNLLRVKFLPHVVEIFTPERATEVQTHLL